MRAFSTIITFTLILLILSACGSQQSQANNLPATLTAIPVAPTLEPTAVAQIDVAPTTTPLPSAAPTILPSPSPTMTPTPIFPPFPGSQPIDRELIGIQVHP
ncbi:MAG: hypothetical protein AAF902_13165, partial [Chloroflexota bacterium]